MLITRRRLVLLVTVVCLSSRVFAQAYHVSYLDGTAKKKSNASWIELVMGDQIGPHDLIRLAEASYLEIAGSTNLTISQPGDYSIQRLVSAAHAIDGSGARSVLAAVLSNLVRNDDPRMNTVMGVRSLNGEGAPTSDSEGVRKLLDAGRGKLKAGDIAAAIAEFQQAVQKATYADIPLARYFLGSAFALAGRTQAALVELSDIRDSRDAPWWADYALLKAKLLIDTSAYSVAAQWLVSQGPRITEDPNRATIYYFLLGVAYRGTGEIDKARVNLIAVIGGGDSGLATAAQHLLERP